jgi:arsenate reductase
MSGDQRVTSVLFVCTENSNRSQLAEAFARIHGQGTLQPYSAGSRPSGKVSPHAVRAMGEVGYDLSTHRSKSVSEVPPGPYDFVITMGCGDDCPYIPAAERDDWNLTDPRDMSPGEFNVVRDEIEVRVEKLLERVTAG